LALLLALACAGCGREELDLLVRAQKTDPCLAFTTQDECGQNTALGCAFQPNAVGCRSDDPTCPPGMCRSGDAFVRRAGRSFTLNGAPFRFAGVSSWAMLQPDTCATVKAPARAAWIQSAYDDLVPSNAKVARFFAFQSCAGAFGDDFTLFDTAVSAARRAGVRVQFALDNDDGGCSDGMKRDAAWYGGGYDKPDGTYPLSYSQFAESVAMRYRDEPTVLGFLLVQGFGNADPTVLSSFVTTMGQRLHGLAPNQLLSIDLEWQALPDDGGTSYRQIQGLPEVDFIDIDDYTFTYPPKPLNQDQLAALSQIDKPAVVGEGAFGLLSGDASGLAMRGAEMQKRVELWSASGLNGALLWAYDPGWTAVSEEFDARQGDPILQAGGVLATAPW
jgi:hypothetical protein